MDNVIRAIPVTDGNGDELLVFEYQQSSPYRVLMSLNRAGAARRWVLDSGEEVRWVADDLFVIVATGERLTPIAPPG